MADKYNPNYRRDRLAENILCSLVSSYGDTLFRDDYLHCLQSFVNVSVDLATRFIDATKPIPEESVAVAEVDEFDDSLVIDSE